MKRQSVSDLTDNSQVYEMELKLCKSRKKQEISFRFRDLTADFQSPTFLYFYVENRALVVL